MISYEHQRGKNCRLAVIFGGQSSEHEVSLMSATSILQNLDPEKYDVTMVGITKTGKWLLYTGPVEDLTTGAWERGPVTPAFLSPDPTVHGLVALRDTGAQVIPLDVIFPRPPRQKWGGRHYPRTVPALRHPLCGLRHPVLRRVHG